MIIEGDKLVPVMFMMLILIIFKHFNNIKRLIRGKETKIILKKIK
jgi:glycerol-3-phosphate acyltransferase PlsY